MSSIAFGASSTFFFFVGFGQNDDLVFPNFNLHRFPQRQILHGNPVSDIGQFGNVNFYLVREIFRQSFYFQFVQNLDQNSPSSLTAGAIPSKQYLHRL